MHHLTDSVADLAQAVQLLHQGLLVAMPTETVYGLAARADSDRAVAKIFAAKGRPRINPLIAHVADLAAAQRLVQLDALSQRLAEQFWPGPLTLVLPRQPNCPVSLLASAGLDTLAVRVPAHPVALRLLAACGTPLVAPSANLSGQLSPTAAGHVDPRLAAAVIDGGPCRVGVESTVVQVIGNQAWLLRPGGIARDALAAVAGPLRDAEDAAHPRSPGQLASHYAPQLPVRLHAREVRGDEALLALGDDVPAGAALTLNLSPSGDLEIAAANLFAYLRALDQPQLRGIAVVPIPGHGLGEAINDRLRRAATR